MIPAPRDLLEESSGLLAQDIGAADLVSGVVVLTGATLADVEGEFDSTRHGRTLVGFFASVLRMEKKSNKVTILMITVQSEGASTVNTEERHFRKYRYCHWSGRRIQQLLFRRINFGCIFQQRRQGHNHRSIGRETVIAKKITNKFPTFPTNTPIPPLSPRPFTILTVLTPAPCK